ncbi:interferon-induced, double-stranded RNA-activated protein kinase-like isoform X2 [Spea bombifrons]|uniref:interferon-induced, double-stranded RNA-activated protein kinase-like isoform X2 n=1 Tax=Spea bombifrons TaxID=233779 RepID=UPI00234AD2CD|nr:interferon-induced, double-stranded RNA-activated protein kinase-like isoform X2 [Spea bombifrons]
MEQLNCRGQLITYCAHNNLVLRFDQTLQTGQPHDPMFTARVYVNEELLGEAHGKKKKEAENKAARNALKTLENRELQALPAALNLSDHQESNTRESEKNETTNGSAQGPQAQPNYVGIFNQFCQKKGWGGAGFRDTGCRGPPHFQEFFVRATNGIKDFPEAKGKSKKQAKHKAAFLAILELKRDHPPDILLQSVIPESYVDESGSETPGSTDSVHLDSGNGHTGTAGTDVKVSFGSSTSGIPSTPEMPEDPLKGFDNITNLDKGGFGNVFKARKILDKKFYAVKRVALKKEATLLEVQALANMDHPNIVRYYNSWTANDFSSGFCSTSSSSSETETSTGNTIKMSLFIQMELCEDGNLKEWIERMQTVDKNKSLDVFQQIVEGVIYIHSNNFIHRDLKPANILFSKKKVKIGDFGLVAQIKVEQEIQALQRTQGAGTPMYMAPEQSGSFYENEVDIFPLGLILFQLLWIFKTFHEVWPNLRKGQLPEKFEKQYPFEEAIIRKMLSNDPKKRPTAIKLKELLDIKHHFDNKTC